MDALSGYDVVITTYHVVASESRPRKDKNNPDGQMKRGVLFQRAWHRVVLDEAHMGILCSDWFLYTIVLCVL